MAENKTYDSTMETDQPPSYAPRQEPELPSYQDVERGGPPPPSYESLYGRAKAIKRESSSAFDFVKRIVFLLVGTIGFTIFLGIMLAIPIAMIAIGSKYLNDCPAEHYIPIYLIVAGCFGTLRNSITILRRFFKNKEEEEENQRKVNPVESVIDCFMFAWFIAGNVWIYRTRGDFSTDPSADNFCDPTLYWFAFWITTAVYIIMGCSCFCCCFCGLLAMCFGSDGN